MKDSVQNALKCLEKVSIVGCFHLTANQRRWDHFHSSNSFYRTSSQRDTESESATIDSSSAHHLCITSLNKTNWVSGPVTHPVSIDPTSGRWIVVQEVHAAGQAKTSRGIEDQAFEPAHGWRGFVNRNLLKHIQLSDELQENNEMMSITCSRQLTCRDLHNP